MDKRMQRLLHKKDFEVTYHSLYQQNPEMYRRVHFRNWQEFTDEYLATSKDRMRLPEGAPTPISETLSEKAFFSDDAREVCLVMNARFCPPFWHDHDFIKIMYVLSGSFYFYTSRDERIRISRGNILIVPPGTEQSVFSDNWEDCVVNIFLRIGTFEKAFSSLLSDASLLSGYFWNMLYGKDMGSVIWIQSDGNARLDGFILDMLDAEDEGRESINFFLVSFVMAFLATATSDYRDRIRSIHGTQVNIGLLPMMLQFIRKNYSTVTLDDLAEHFGKSHLHLSPPTDRLYPHPTA